MMSQVKNFSLVTLCAVLLLIEKNGKTYNMQGVEVR